MAESNKGHGTSGQLVKPQHSAWRGWLCLWIAVYALIALPGMHSIVHLLEAQAGHHRLIVESNPDQRTTLGGPRHHHHHHSHGGGGNGLLHGDGSPEHLGVAFLELSMPALPARPEPVVLAALLRELESSVLSPRPEPRTSRGPPALVV